MTDEELDAIEARANAATPGPWGAHGCGSTHDLVLGDGEKYLQIAHTRSVGGCGMIWNEAQITANAAFIAEARQDIPALVAEVRRQSAEVFRLRGAITDMLIHAEGTRSFLVQEDAYGARPNLRALSDVGMNALAEMPNLEASKGAVMEILAIIERHERKQETLRDAASAAGNGPARDAYEQGAIAISDLRQELLRRVINGTLREGASR